MQRVEESERRYSEALDELHARLDQLSQTTDAARMAGSPEDAATFDRLHDQVSSLARRLEGEASTPLDDFERLGRALAGDLDYGSGFPGTPSTPDQLGPSPFAGSAPFAPPMPAPDYSAPFSFPVTTISTNVWWTWRIGSSTRSARPCRRRRSTP